jgi:hypothetical protein
MAVSLSSEYHSKLQIYFLYSVSLFRAAKYIYSSMFSRLINDIKEIDLNALSVSLFDELATSHTFIASSFVFKHLHYQHFKYVLNNTKR